jgi:hypothetical protein
MSGGSSAWSSAETAADAANSPLLGGPAARAAEGFLGVVCEDAAEMLSCIFNGAAEMPSCIFNVEAAEMPSCIFNGASGCDRQGTATGPNHTS